MTCFSSDGGCPGTSGTRISELFSLTKSVQALSFSLASWLASSTAFEVAVISSRARSLSVEKGSVSSLSTFATRSASATCSSSSLSSCSAFSKASLRLRSCSMRASSAFRCCSLICSMRCFPCSSPVSASCFIRSFWEAQASSSFCSVSWSSFSSSSMLAGVARRTFWSTRRMLSMARCSSFFCAISFSRCARSASCFFRSSSCCCFISSTRFRCSSMRLRLASSSFFRFSSSCLRWASICC
mmetsp:Transcript_100267/g.266535  ORF Transcript_100267/g.266535 Transcript_100267/m.266535 type:complete len:242 (+) Transcript_100267:1071-1796(+)